MIKTYTFSEMKSGDIFSRTEEENRVAAVVTDIIKDVRTNGDEALIRYAEKFDKAILTSLEVTEAEIEEAVASVEPEFLRILTDAAVNIRAFHENQKRDEMIRHGPYQLDFIKRLCYALKHDGSCWRIKTCLVIKIE